MWDTACETFSSFPLILVTERESSVARRKTLGPRGRGDDGSVTLSSFPRKRESSVVRRKTLGPHFRGDDGSGDTVRHFLS
jgi:hypothetical protein